MIVLLTEEPSIKGVIKSVLAQTWPERLEGVDWLVIAFDGKADLERKIHDKMKSWNYGNPHFIIVRDNDGGNCVALKERLHNIACKSGKPHHVRIVCQELENWFFGDLAAVAAAYPKATIPQNYHSYRVPDRLNNASQELGKLTGDITKIGRAETIAKHLSPDNNSSHSFNVFYTTLKELICPQP